MKGTVPITAVYIAHILASHSLKHSSLQTPSVRAALLYPFEDRELKQREAKEYAQSHQEARGRAG